MNNRMIQMPRIQPLVRRLEAVADLIDDARFVEDARAALDEAHRDNDEAEKIIRAMIDWAPKSRRLWAEKWLKGRAVMIGDVRC